MFEKGFLVDPEYLSVQFNVLRLSVAKKKKVVVIIYCSMSSEKIIKDVYQNVLTKHDKPNFRRPLIVVLAV